MNIRTIVFFSIMCYVVAPIAFAVMGYKAFFLGLDNLQILPLLAGTVSLLIAALIPYRWTDELIKKIRGK